MFCSSDRLASPLFFSSTKRVLRCCRIPFSLGEWGCNAPIGIILSADVICTVNLEWACKTGLIHKQMYWVSGAFHTCILFLHFLFTSLWPVASKKKELKSARRAKSLWLTLYQDLSCWKNVLFLAWWVLEEQLTYAWQFFWWCWNIRARHRYVAFLLLCLAMGVNGILQTVSV